VRKIRTFSIVGAAALASPALAAPVNLIDVGNRLITVDSATPTAITNTVAITGIRGNETLLDIDFRPASSRVLYGLGSAGTLYAINPRTGGATAVGASAPVFGFAAGIDFNPVVDALRVVTVTNNNYRVSAATGALLGSDVPPAYAAGDSGVGTTPRIVSVAYTNNAQGATSTTLYVIDANRGVLAVQGSVGGTPVSPSAGVLTTVGSLGVPTNTFSGFDISRSGTALATLTRPGSNTTALYSINLTTGAATLLGTIGAGGRSYLGLAFAPAAIASYGSTANQIGVGTALDNFVGVPSATLNGAFNALDGLDAAGQASALSQLTPGAYTLLPQVTLKTADFQADTLQRYLRDVRDGATGGRVSGDGHIGSFLVASGRTGHYNAATDRGRVDYGGAGVIGGLDLRSDRFVIGVMGGYDQADARLGENVQNSQIRSYFGGGYATAHVGGAYLDVFGSYGEADYDLRRTVAFGTVNLGFNSSTHSRTGLGGATVGFKLSSGGIVLEPYAGVRYASVRINGFSDGSDFGALTLGRNDYESVLGNFGAKLGSSVAVGNAVVRPEVRGAFRREFKNNAANGFTYGFGGTGAPTNVAFTPSPLARSYATAGAGITVSGPRSPLSLVIDYDGEFARDRQIHGITGGLRYVF